MKVVPPEVPAEFTDRVHIILPPALLVASAFNLPPGAESRIVKAPSWLQQDIEQLPCAFRGRCCSGGPVGVGSFLRRRIRVTRTRQIGMPPAAANRILNPEAGFYRYPQPRYCSGFFGPRRICIILPPKRFAAKSSQPPLLLRCTCGLERQSYFLYAGASRVIVSLWNVNDRATADLMAALYRDMLREGKSPASALRTAQLELRRKKRWESPYYWAAFEQYGEYK